MTISLGAFFAGLVSNPILLVVFLLVLGVIIVNGATDASNAIATAISTRSISANKAIVMGAICNFIGLIVMTYLSTAVASTIAKMVNFGGNDQAALIALAAAMVAIIVWGVVAWYFGIPTSQSHSLIAGLTGAAIALQNGFAGINGAEWMKVVYGLVLSTVLGFGSGWVIAKVIEKTCGRARRSTANKTFGRLQVAAAAGLAFMHGAQDGQKFMSIGMLGVTLALGLPSDNLTYPLWIMIACALFMAIGSGIGGKKIIKSVGMDMVHLEKYQGFASSLAATLCLLLATLTGLPVSTTHTKTTSIMGVGAAKRVKSVKWAKAGNMVLTWIATFPGCGIIGYALAKLFLLFV